MKPIRSSSWNLLLLAALVPAVDAQSRSVERDPARAPRASRGSPPVRLGCPTGLADPISAPIEPIGLPIRLELVASGLTAPNWGTDAPGDPGHLYVVDQTGILWRIELATGTKTVFLDVSARLVALGVAGPGSFDERGFLGVAFHPGYTTNGLLYTYTSEPEAGPADFTTLPVGVAPNHQSVVAEWQVPDPSAPNPTVDPMSRRELLRIDEPQFNHDGGCLNFGPDGFLYVSIGDGGMADDQGAGHVPGGNGQDPTNILGTIVRIDPLGSNSANGAYGIPADNPFVNQAGLDEVFAFGFRNPFRFSFDETTGLLCAGDVGQNAIEEIDVVVAGGNYGWNFKEGSFFFDPAGDCNGIVTNVDPGVPPGLIDPVLEYDHDEGIAVIGGFTYRGGALPLLQGLYVFGDFAQTGNNDGRLFHTVPTPSGTIIVEFRFVGQKALGMSLLGLGEDAAKELYVLANATGTPFEKTGVVLKIVAP